MTRKYDIYTMKDHNGHAFHALVDEIITADIHGFMASIYCAAIDLERPHDFGVNKEPSTTGGFCYATFTDEGGNEYYVEDHYNCLPM